MQPMRVECLERNVVYQGFFRMEKLRLRHELFGGGMSAVLSREIFRRGHAVAVLLYDPQRDKVVLIRQFRPGAIDLDGGAWLIEIVAGMIHPGEGEDSVARRECLEEAGCEVTALLPICRFIVSPGGSDETVQLYCGRVDAGRAGGVHGLAHEGEDIRVEVVTFSQAMIWLEQGRINSSAPIIALQWLALNRERVRQAWS